jgi:hypothetical protein
LTWKFDYTSNKVIPLIILYETEKNVNDRSIKPKHVVKVRKRAFKQLYEVVWFKMNKFNNHDWDQSDLSEYTTLEDLDFINNTFPELVKNYTEQIDSKIKKRCKRITFN